MAELGNKFICYNCSTKFYDLGKAEALCPKCGANQKDAEKNDQSALTPAARRKRKAEVVKPLDVEDEEVIDEIPGEDLGTEDEIALSDDELEEEDFDDEET
jgi:uncharacterized protein (TIGR02300 family)